MTRQISSRRKYKSTTPHVRCKVVLWYSQREASPHMLRRQSRTEASIRVAENIKAQLRTKEQACVVVLPAGSVSAFATTAKPNRGFDSSRRKYKSATPHARCKVVLWYSQRESNPQLPLRRGPLYPFNYGSEKYKKLKFVLLNGCNGSV